MAKATAPAKVKTKRKAKPATPATADVTVTALPTATGSQADYDLFLPAAKKLHPSALIPMRADAQLALHNVQLGVDHVLAEHARLAKLPETDVAELTSLPRLALAVIFATTQLAPATGTSGLADKIARGAVLRALLLKTADALSLAGLVPRVDVDKIRAGHGKLDAARDLVALTALFAKHAPKVRGKHAITAAQLKESADLGTELLQLLKPGRARRASSGPAVGADERDRLWTLLAQAHDRLWRAGAYLFGRSAVDAKVPSLQASRGGRPKKVAAAAAPAKTPTAPVGATP